MYAAVCAGIVTCVGTCRELKDLEQLVGLLQLQSHKKDDNNDNMLSLSQHSDNQPDQVCM